jgi:DNA-binding beta-propeller fold protein YncE
MMRRLALPTVVSLVLLVAAGARSPAAGGAAAGARGSLLDAAVDYCLDAALADDPPTARAAPVNVLDDKWPPGAIGGEIEPIRVIADLYPTFDGLAVDSVNGRVVMSDENRHGLMSYARSAGGSSEAVTEPLRHVFGPKTRIGFAAGVAVDPIHKEAYTVNNDGGDQLLVYGYDAHGNVEPTRYLRVPHQSWGVSLSNERDEIALSVQQSNAIVVYGRAAKGLDAPRRQVSGARSQLHDPHGIVLDGVHNEIVVANHGNWTKIRPYTMYDPLVSATNEPYEPGRFFDPSITVHSATADGEAAPLRTIEGRSTRLNWPMGIALDGAHHEIFVANYGDSSVLVFARTAKGDVAPARVLRGALTGIVGPVGIGIDTRNDELWVANYGDHTAVVFPRAASGNVKPARTVRNAPPETPTCGLTNVSAAAYDARRGAILVPN